MQAEPTISGTYEYLTGGNNYTEADITAGDHIQSLWPSVSKWLTMIRNLLPAVATELHAEGVTHVIDFASGMPVNHIHDNLPGAKVVYSDLNPNVVKQAQAITKDDPNALYLQHDINKPLDLVNSPQVQDFLGDIDRLAIGMSGVAAFLEPNVLQANSEKLYHWAPSGTLFYSEFDCKNPNKITPKFQQFIDMMADQLGVYYLYSEE
jgi:hypothetical protein